MPRKFEKTANEVLDYKFDFKPYSNGRDNAESDFLESGETIASYTLTVETGITVDSDALADTDTTVLVWMSGGTLKGTYTITCEAVTSDGRTVVRSIVITIVPPRARE